MPKGYSLDFRKKVMDCLASGVSANAASLTFNLSANTVRNWQKRYQKEGHYQERRHAGRKPRLSREDLDAYMKSHPDSTLASIASHFDMAIPSVFHRLKKFGYSYKKKSPAMWRQAQKNDLPT